MSSFYLHYNDDEPIDSNDCENHIETTDSNVSENINPRNIYQILDTTKYPGFEVNEYINSPILGRKSIMKPLGDFITIAEHILVEKIDPNLWYTLRADGKNFSKLIRDGKKSGLFGKGYSLLFENAMIEAVQDVFGTKFYGVCAFTQSDELTMLFRPCQRTHDGHISNWESNGLLVKNLTHQSSGIASRFVYHLIRQMNEEILKKIDLELLSLKSIKEIGDVIGLSLIDFSNLQVLKDNLMKITKIPIVEFDCRFAAWDSFLSGFQVIIWRAWDCASNGVSSGIHMATELQNKKIKAIQNTTDKLITMKNENLLDKLTEHQKYGTFFYWEICSEEKYLNYNKSTILVSRKIIKRFSYPLLTLFKEGFISFNSESNLIEISPFTVDFDINKRETSEEDTGESSTHDNDVNDTKDNIIEMKSVIRKIETPGKSQTEVPRRLTHSEKKFNKKNAKSGGISSSNINDVTNDERKDKEKKEKSIEEQISNLRFVEVSNSGDILKYKCLDTIVLSNENIRELMKPLNINKKLNFTPDAIAKNFGEWKCGVKYNKGSIVSSHGVNFMSRVNYNNFSLLIPDYWTRI